MRSATAGFHPAIRQGLGLPAYYKAVVCSLIRLPFVQRGAGNGQGVWKMPSEGFQTAFLSGGFGFADGEVEEGGGSG